MGYKHTIYDDPKLIQLLARAGIKIQGVDYDKKTTELIEDADFGSDYAADSKTISL